MPNNNPTIDVRAFGPPNDISDQIGEDGPSLANSPISAETGPTRYEFIDSQELGRRLAVPTSWIRDQVRARSQDPLPHVNFGKYVRFLWGSPALELWIRRRIVVENNRRVERVR